MQAFRAHSFLFLEIAKNITHERNGMTLKKEGAPQECPQTKLNLQVQRLRAATQSSLWLRGNPSWSNSHGSIYPSSSTRARCTNRKTLETNKQADKQPSFCPGRNTGRNLSLEPWMPPFPHRTHLTSSRDNAAWSPCSAPEGFTHPLPASLRWARYAAMLTNILLKNSPGGTMRTIV